MYEVWCRRISHLLWPRMDRRPATPCHRMLEERTGSWLKASRSGVSAWLGGSSVIEAGWKDVERKPSVGRSRLGDRLERSVPPVRHTGHASRHGHDGVGEGRLKSGSGAPGAAWNGHFVNKMLT